MMQFETISMPLGDDFLLERQDFGLYWFCNGDYEVVAHFGACDFEQLHFFALLIYLCEGLLPEFGRRQWFLGLNFNDIEYHVGVYI